MSTVLTDVDTWHEQVPIPEDGDETDQASIEPSLQVLANRTRWLANRQQRIAPGVDPIYVDASNNPVSRLHSEMIPSSAFVPERMYLKARSETDDGYIGIPIPGWHRSQSEETGPLGSGTVNPGWVQLLGGFAADGITPALPTLCGEWRLPHGVRLKSVTMRLSNVPLGTPAIEVHAGMRERRTSGSVDWRKIVVRAAADPAVFTIDDLHLVPSMPASADASQHTGHIRLFPGGALWCLEWAYCTYWKPGPV